MIPLHACRVVLVAVLAALPGLTWPAQLDMTVTLEPAERKLRGEAVITVPPGGPFEIVLDARYRVDSLVVGGTPQPWPATGQRGERPALRLAVHARERTVAIAWQGVLDPLDPKMSHRDTLRAAAPVADERGSFLPGVSAWHPVPTGGLTGYRLTIDLPSSQKGLAPGSLVEETQAYGRYRALFELKEPADGVDLVAGPYRIRERTVRSIDGRPLRLRTYFHTEIYDLAKPTIDGVRESLAEYERRIGPYPYDGFSVASSPTPTGFGMPALTYLGVQVLKLPFVRSTSIPHEVLHCWWGHGVRPDYGRGNWSEGLTTFMADYARKERESAEAARTMRLEWLRDFAALPASEDRPVATFVARHHGASQIVGYLKVAMIFAMLRDALGTDLFEAALRGFWERHRSRTASWDDIRVAFERVSDRDLKDFFEQWIQRSGAPAVRMAHAETHRVGDGWRALVRLEQSTPPYRVRVPLKLRTASGEHEHSVPFDQASATFAIESTEPPLDIALDPDFRVFRRLAETEAPPVLRNLMVDPRTVVVVPTSDPAAVNAARELSRRMLDHEPDVIGADQPLPPSVPVLVIGLTSDLQAWLARAGLPDRPRELPAEGTGAAWIVRTAGPGLVGVIGARDVEELSALVRPLPHYGRASWLVLEGGKVLARGVWPATPQRWRFEESATR